MTSSINLGTALVKCCQDNKRHKVKIADLTREGGESVDPKEMRAGMWLQTVSNQYRVHSTDHTCYYIPSYWVMSSFCTRSETEIRKIIAQLYRTTSDTVVCFGVRRFYGGGKSTGFDVFA